MQRSDFYDFFSQPKINSGKKSLEHIPFELDTFDARKPLVITTPEISEQGLVKKLLKALYDSNVVVGAVYDDTTEYPSISIIKDLATLYYDRGCDSIIALGTGSLVDVAKGLNMLVSKKTDDLLQFEGNDMIEEHLRPLFVVLTGAPEGYEISRQAKIENRLFISDHLYPDGVFIDSRMAVIDDLPKIYESALSALTHAIESAADPIDNPMTDSYALAAIQFISTCIKTLSRKPKSKEGSIELLNASAMSGVAFSNAPAGIAHLMGTRLAELTGYPEGYCMGIILPYSLDYKMKKGIPVREELLLALTDFDEFSMTPESERAGKALNILFGIVNNSSVSPSALKEMKVPTYMLEEAAKFGASLNYRGFTYEDCLLIINHANEGVPVPVSAVEKVKPAKSSGKKTKKSVPKKKTSSKKKTTAKKKSAASKKSSKKAPAKKKAAGKKTKSAAKKKGTAKKSGKKRS